MVFSKYHPDLDFGRKGYWAIGLKYLIVRYSIFIIKKHVFYLFLLKIENQTNTERPNFPMPSPDKQPTIIIIDNANIYSPPQKAKFSIYFLKKILITGQNFSEFNYHIKHVQS